MNDPTVLWINAGVTPLKKYFDGTVVPSNRRLTSCNNADTYDSELAKIKSAVEELKPYWTDAAGQEFFQLFEEKYAVRREPPAQSHFNYRSLCNQ